MITKMLNCKSQLSNIQIYKSKMVNIHSSFRALTGLAKTRDIIKKLPSRVGREIRYHTEEKKRLALL